jgi:hypothetical protein
VLAPDQRVAVALILSTRLGKGTHRHSRLRTSLARAFTAAGRQAEFDELLLAIRTGTPIDDAALAFAAECLTKLPTEIVVPRY